MMKKMMLAVAMLALVAAPSFAAVQNVKVGGDLKTTSVIRNAFDLGGVDTSDSYQNLVVSQVGLNVSADLTDNVSTMIRLNNENIWGDYSANNGTGNTAGVNVDTAYVTMKEMLYAPLSVTIGRQSLAYGNQFIIGDGDRTGAITEATDLTGGVNFDAVKAVLSYDPLTVDVFAAKVSDGSSTSTAFHNDDTDLFGINMNYKLGDKMGTVVEAYTFARMTETPSASGRASDRLYVPGLRVSVNPIEGINLQLEGAYQKGNTDLDNGAALAVNKVSAYGLQGMMNYALPVLKDMKPVLSASYTYLSGDKVGTGGGANNNNSTTNKAWTSLYENQNGGRIFDAILTQSNLQIGMLAFELTPVQDITTKLSWYNLSNAVKYDEAATYSLSGPDGVSSTAVVNNDSKALGNELDLDVSYAYTEDVKFGVSAGMYMPGKFFSRANKDNASQILSSVRVLF